MRTNLRRSHRDSMLRVISVIIGVAVSALFSYICYILDLPIFMDGIGAVCVACLGGWFPGIVTAIATDIVCTVFNDNALYFAIVNAISAVYTAWFVREKDLKSVKNVAIFAVVSGVITGGISGIFQWLLFGQPQNAGLAMIVDAVELPNYIPKILLFIAINIILNIGDKSLSIILVLFVLRLIPEDISIHIRNSGWRQQPLDAEHMRRMDAVNSDIRFPLKRRMTLMLLIVAFGLTIIMGWIGMTLYYNNAKNERTENAYSAVHFAADVIDADRIKYYIREGRNSAGYEETAGMLEKIRSNSSGVKYLYVVTIDEKYVTFVFDVEDDVEGGADPYEPGDKVAIEEAFKPYLPDLLVGKEIEPIESDDTWSWLLTVYYPVFDSNGNCACYVGADVSLEYMADYMKDFIIRVFMILAGFFLLIVAYGLWTTGIYMVYPLDSIVESVDNFINAGSDQNKLDESLRSLRKIDIHTGDEVEKLYHSICDMASSQTEQLRSIRRFSENTAKMQDGLIVTMADLVENRDSDTGAHIQKTAAYVKIIVEGLKKKGYYAEKITPEFMANVVRSAPLHDVGKINIPDKVLNKPGKLTDDEYEIMKSHTTAGRRIMEKAIDTVEGENYLKEARNMAAYHHERWDGKGYPEGLHGEVIPLSARIMAVADVFDALTSQRVYKPPFTLEQALSMIQEGAGSQFDPFCVEVFMESLPEVKVILRKYNGPSREGGTL